MENEGSSSVVASSTPDGTVGWIESMIVTASQTSVGQSLFKLVESFLWVVEKSARWSVPTHELSAEENGKIFGKIELVRPLPWILFLPSLVILRIIRGGLNVGAFLLGYPRIEPSGMVKFMQKSRRRLRALNSKAMKSTRRKMLGKAATPDEKSTTESAGSPTPIEPKRKISQVSSADESTDDATDESKNETLQSMIDRLANDDSTDDPDFNPPDCSTESNTSSENEAEHNVTLSELEDVQKEAEEILKNHKLRSNQLPLDTKTNDKETKEETTNRVARVDSPEPELQACMRISNDFINKEAKTTLSSRLPATPRQEVTNGVVAEKRNEKPNQKPNASSHPRGSNPKENVPHPQEKKTSPRKKFGRKDAK
ncbi:PREDICTED: uncharacterized protein LOC107191613 isoform X2 [Dufourea novaeangliae]|uniref:uncharacterized protein LOC107191613 isoform X2 n=1 Tax=Dufourea novaeangliae TaxID=178035 RepID=UPI000767867A|nr:PREDICTED: uncharacterized protein LOC107191613 isoform X2 [Dufourea novaeangliae]